MARTKGGVPSKNSDQTTYIGRDDVERAYYYGKRDSSKSYSLNKRSAAWYRSYNNAIALYRYMLNKDNYDYDIILTENGTIYDNTIDDFKEANLIFDNNFNEEAFNVGKNHSVRIIRLKDKNIKLEYLDDFVDSDVIDKFEKYISGFNKNR